MTTVIMGNNSTGKTLFIRGICKNNPNIVTNLPEYASVHRNISRERVQVFMEETGLDLVVVGDAVSIISDYPGVTQESFQLLRLVCSVGDILLLDEYDLMTHNEDELALLNLIVRTLHVTFDSCYIVTHRSSFLYLPGMRLCTVGVSGDLIDVSPEDAYDNSF